MIALYSEVRRPGDWSNRVLKEGGEECKSRVGLPGPFKAWGDGGGGLVCSGFPLDTHVSSQAPGMLCLALRCSVK